MTTKWARLNAANAVQEYRDFPDDFVPVNILHKDIRWLPYVEDPEPVYDIEIETIAPSIVVEAQQVRRTWIVTGIGIVTVKATLVRRVQTLAMRPICNALPTLAAVAVVTTSRNNTVDAINAAVTSAAAIAAFRASVWAGPQS